jgi:hypothetical protein
VVVVEVEEEVVAGEEAIQIQINQWTTMTQETKHPTHRQLLSWSGHRVDVQRQSRNAAVEKFTLSNFKVTTYNK